MRSKEDIKKKLIHALDLDFMPDDDYSRSKDLVLDQHIGASSEYTSSLRVLYFRLTDVDAGVGIAVFQPRAWWTERGGRSYKEIPVNNWDEIVAILDKYPVKAKRVMRYAQEYVSAPKAKYEEQMSIIKGMTKHLNESYRIIDKN